MNFSFKPLVQYLVMIATLYTTICCASVSEGELTQLIEHVSIYIRENRFSKDQLHEIQSRIQELYTLYYEEMLARGIVSLQKSRDLVQKGYDFFILNSVNKDYWASNNAGMYTATINFGEKSKESFKFEGDQGEKVFKALEKKYQEQQPKLSD